MRLISQRRPCLYGLYSTPAFFEVKELCENAIDAGAKSVTVEIQRGGMALIRVADDLTDGCEGNQTGTGDLAPAWSRRYREGRLA